MDNDIVKTGMDPALVIQWNGRPKRTRKPPPKTYWDEYVATDTWYVRELVADVPPEELQAALEDEDWAEMEGYEDGDEAEGAADPVVDDPDYSSDAEDESDGSDSEDEGSDLLTDSVASVSDILSANTTDCPSWDEWDDHTSVPYSPYTPDYSPSSPVTRSPSKARTAA